MFTEIVSQTCYYYNIQQGKMNTEKKEHFILSRFVRVSNRKDGTRDPERYHSYVCFNHELLTAKLNAYVVSPRALRLIHGYLPNRKKRTTIDDKY